MADRICAADRPAGGDAQADSKARRYRQSSADRTAKHGQDVARNRDGSRRCSETVIRSTSSPSARRGNQKRRRPRKRRQGREAANVLPRSARASRAQSRAKPLRPRAERERRPLRHSELQTFTRAGGARDAGRSAAGLNQIIKRRSIFRRSMPSDLIRGQEPVRRKFSSHRKAPSNAPRQIRAEIG